VIFWRLARFDPTADSNSANWAICVERRDVVEDVSFFDDHHGGNNLPMKRLLGPSVVTGECELFREGNCEANASGYRRPKSGGGEHNASARRN
jgi:hypothetical protein